MIFVSLGTQKFKFDRLIEYVERLINEKIISDVTIQNGFTKCNIKNSNCFAFMKSDEYDAYLKKCDIFITHGGVGSIMNGLKNHKKIIVVPRKKEYKEHVDSHQYEITNEFEKMGLIICCETYEELKKKVLSINDFNVEKKVIFNNENKILENICEYLNNN